MRKRIIIAVLAIVVIGGLAVALTQSRKGTVEYHRKQYYIACSGELPNSIWQTCWSRISDRSSSYWQRARAQIELHERVLVNNGDFNERRFTLTNNPPQIVFDRVISEWGAAFPKTSARHFLFGNGNYALTSPSEQVVVRIKIEGTNMLLIVGKPTDMPNWEELVRKADASGNDIPPHPFVPVLY